MPKLANQSEIDVSDDDDNVDLYSCQKNKKNKRKPLDFSIAQPKRYRNENISKENPFINDLFSIFFLNFSSINVCPLVFEKKQEQERLK